MRSWLKKWLGIDRLEDRMRRNRDLWEMRWTGRGEIATEAAHRELDRLENLIETEAAFRRLEGEN